MECVAHGCDGDDGGGSECNTDVAPYSDSDVDDDVHFEPELAHA